MHVLYLHTYICTSFIIRPYMYSISSLIVTPASNTFAELSNIYIIKDGFQDR